MGERLRQGVSWWPLDAGNAHVVAVWGRVPSLGRGSLEQRWSYAGGHFHAGRVMLQLWGEYVVAKLIVAGSSLAPLVTPKTEDADLTNTAQSDTA